MKKSIRHAATAFAVCLAAAGGIAATATPAAAYNVVPNNCNISVTTVSSPPKVTAEQTSCSSIAGQQFKAVLKYYNSSSGGTLYTARGNLGYWGTKSVAQHAGYFGGSGVENA
ncbi:MAG: hypothetical protein LBK95_16215 [Bifidobacteriaceae bacterium]|jgi:hypothetical protein|nr:hypothetical protein [Bifidobacteriaceae bacterium]